MRHPYDCPKFLATSLLLDLRLAWLRRANDWLAPASSNSPSTIVLIRRMTPPFACGRQGPPACLQILADNQSSPPSPSRNARILAKNGHCAQNDEPDALGI